MAITTHPNQLDSRRGLRAGLIGLGFVALAGVAALGYSVVDYDSTPAPAAVDFPTVDEMRAENMEIRRQIAAAAAAAEVPVATDFPSNDEMREENQIIRDQVGATASVADAPVVGHGPTEWDLSYAQEWARRLEIMQQQQAEAAAAARSVPVSH